MLLVTSEIANLLDGKTRRPAFSESVADHLVGNFVAGWRVFASMQWRTLPTKFKKRFRLLDLERLEDENGIDEVWALCVRKPKPGWRLLGRFLERDVFVAISAHDRHDLAPEEKYAARARDMMAAWDRMDLPQPLRGKQLNDYLGGVFLDVDKEYQLEKK